MYEFKLMSIHSYVGLDVIYEYVHVEMCMSVVLMMNYLGSDYRLFTMF